MSCLLHSVPLVMALALWPSSAKAVRFRYPVDGHTTITTMYDHDGRDFSCGRNTYLGHRGTDFAGDFGTPVVAAAPGVVTAADHTWNDRNRVSLDERTGEFLCPQGEPSLGNFVQLEHDDGTTTLYAHLKRYSVVPSVGDRVGCGDKVGEMASSGCSTGNHLHFEVREAGSAVDPFAGDCNDRESMWIEQTAGLPGSTCDSNACEGQPDVQECIGDVLRVCVAGRYQGEDCGHKGGICISEEGLPRCLIACNLPDGFHCMGNVLRRCVGGQMIRENDCGRYGGVCSEELGACAPEGWEGLLVPVDAPADEPDAGEAGQGFLTGGCRTSGSTGGPLGVWLLVLVILWARCGGKRVRMGRLHVGWNTRVTQS